MKLSWNTINKKLSKMKNIKILIASCLMLVCAANVSAQWRFGFEWNQTFMTQYNYDRMGVFHDKTLNAMGGMAGLLTAEYILPRTWTPNNLSPINKRSYRRM